MTPSPANDLREARQRAAARSGGTSSHAIRALVLRLLREERAAGRLLDFGAGRGELLRQLHASGTFDRLAGADLMPRPADLPASIAWHHHDLNEPLPLEDAYDAVVCSETIEHLENPRHVFRTLYRLVAPGGVLVLTMPNQECLRSYAGLLARGHFTQFLGECYPAHITALLRLDLERLCAEAGFTRPRFAYTNQGAVPAATSVSWQEVSAGMLRGRLFSDNLGMAARRPR